MTLSRPLVVLPLVVLATLACGGVSLPGPDPAALAGTAQAAAGSALETATALAGEIKPTALAALTQAAEMAGTAQALATALPHATASPDDADTAITTYAGTVLGIDVSILKSGGMTGEVAQALSLSPSGMETQAQVQNAAYATYGALLSNGAASVSYGSGTVSGDIQVDIQAASLGIFSLHSGSGAGSESEALGLVKTAFPGIADRAYTPVSTPKGFAWTYEGQTQGIDLKSGQLTQVSERIVVGVQNPLLQTLVYAIVGRGELATQVKFPGR